MEAMSPFLKKKAHILEVLRKLEESDPLKFHPSACYYYHGQALLPGETFVTTSAPRQPHCRHSSSDSDIHEYANVEGAQQDSLSPLRHGGCPSCRILTQRSSLDSLLKRNQGLGVGSHPGREDGQMCSEDPGASAQSTDPKAKMPDKTNQPNTHNRANVTSFSQSTKSTTYLSSLVAGASELGGDIKDRDSTKISPKKGANSSPRQSDSGPSSRDERADECRYLDVATDSERDTSVQVCNGVFSSNEASVSKKVSVESYSPNTLALVQQQTTGKGKFAHSPTSPPSSFGESKSSPVSSPSKVLKFLKIPSMAENTSTANAFRLSPQLTRSSKIPCRNNYEAYQSPVMPRKATTTERDKPPSTSKTDSYPGTHSAPTSPPKPEDTCSSALTKDYSSHSAPKPSRVSKGANQSSQPLKGGQVPHYENILDPSGSPSINGFPPITPDEIDLSDKQKMSLRDERLLSPLSLKTSDSSATTGDSPSDTSDQETDTESPVWQRPQHHFSLPTASANKAQRTNYSSMKDRYHERGPPEPAQKHDASAPAHIPAKRSDKQPPLPKRTVSSKPQTDSSYHPFKERLAALGKLKSTEDLQQALEKREAQSNAGKNVSSSGNSERSKTAERQGERIGMEQRHSKFTDSLDGKPYPKTSFGSFSKGAGSSGSSANEQSTKLMNITSLAEKSYVAKAEGQKIKMGMSSTETPAVMRSYGKCPNPLTHHSKTAPSPQSSPTRVQFKSPSKAGNASSYPRGVKPAQDERSHAQRHPSRADDKPKLTPGKKKTFAHVDSFPPPPPPRSGAELAHGKTVEDKRPAAPIPQSAIEQKVMRGIEENVLKLQEQDRGQTTETKQKTSNGIASWFGLKKSKLPALNRKPEMSKLKLSMSPSSSSSSSGAKDASDAKGGPRKVVESLNISKLMEKAEDLRKALEEERAYVNRVGIALDRPGRGHSCEVVMDQAQGQLSLMYRGVTADSFMQQLLNR